MTTKEKQFENFTQIIEALERQAMKTAKFHIGQEVLIIAKSDATQFDVFTGTVEAILQTKNGYQYMIEDVDMIDESDIFESTDDCIKALKERLETIFV